MSCHRRITLNQRLRGYTQDGLRRKLATACAQHAAVGTASLVLYDVSTLYFETDRGDGFREPGFSEERRLEPQITIGLLTDAAGFPLMVEAFEGNTAETTTMLPTVEAVHGRPPAGRRHRGRRRLDDLRGKQAGHRSRAAVVHPGTKIPDIPYVVQAWRREHPDQTRPTG